MQAAYLKTWTAIVFLQKFDQDLSSCFHSITNVHLLILQKAGFITCIKNSNRSREWLNGYQLTVIWFTMVVPLSILQSNGGPQSGSVNPHTDWRHVSVCLGAISGSSPKLTSLGSATKMNSMKFFVHVKISFFLFTYACIFFL